MEIGLEGKRQLKPVLRWDKVVIRLIRLGKDIKEFSEKIKSEASRLITLIEDIINLSRLDENSYKEERETVDLKELAEICADRLSKAAEKAEVSVKVTYIIGYETIININV